MSSIAAVKGKLVYEQRMANLRATLGSLKSNGVLSAFDTLLNGFGKNNRTLIRNITGGSVLG